jgi:hypothetical protein
MKRQTGHKGFLPRNRPLSPLLEMWFEVRFSRLREFCRCQDEGLPSTISPMNYLLRFVCLAVVLSAISCATSPPPLAPVETAKLDYGPYPENYEQLIKDYFGKTLHDAAAAQFRFGKPYTGYLQHGKLLAGRLQEAGYFTDVWVKAKTASGALTPEKHVVVLIKNGEVLMELADAEIDRIQK